MAMDEVTFKYDTTPEISEHAKKKVAPGGLDQIAELEEDEDDE